MMVDLDDRACRIMAVLLLAAPDRQDMIELETHRALPEREHRFEVVGGKPDIDLRFGPRQNRRPGPSGLTTRLGVAVFGSLATGFAGRVAAGRSESAVAPTRPSANS